MIEFSGAAVRHGPATWGQRAIWRITQWLPPGDPYFNLPWTLAVRGKPGMPEVEAGLRRLMERHESLRTTWHDGLTQRVAGEGKLAVELVEAGGERPREVAARVAARLAATGFDYAGELPLRCAIVTVDGRPRVLAFAFSHLAVDAGAMEVIAREWPLLQTGAPLPPAPQPLELAAYEQSPEGAATGGRALRHWRTCLDRAPHTLFGREEPEQGTELSGPGKPEQGAELSGPGTSEQVAGNPERFVKLGMDSPLCARAATTLAARHGVSTTSVLIAAYVTVLARLTGHRTIALQFIVGNRHAPMTQGLVATLVQDGVFVVETAGDFAATARAAHAQALTAYRRAHYDPAAQQALIAEAGPAPTAYFNDARAFPGWPNLPGSPPPATITELGTWEHVDAQLFFAVDPATHTCRTSLLADTEHLPRARIEETLRGIETLLVTEETA
ncbi:condensation domain-containing protein [Nonomuraea sp. NPDC050663]|uniref:condensation domain-containing protein n=1 Tax=Nonomuraea sp. NPDC050663 TaxID=3364370 RepID=UPI0037A6B968